LCITTRRTSIFTPMWGILGMLFLPWVADMLSPPHGRPTQSLRQRQLGRRTPHHHSRSEALLSFLCSADQQPFGGEKAWGHWHAGAHRVVPLYSAIDRSGGASTGRY
jgi:hypothetical protein